MYRRTLNAGELVVVVRAGSVFRHYSFRQNHRSMPTIGHNVSFCREVIVLAAVLEK